MFLSKYVSYGVLLTLLCAATEEFWNDWIESEQERDEELYIIQLYKRAVAAIPQVELWLQYLKFLRSRRYQGSPSITNGVLRRSCELSLRELGLHATEGPRLWSFYRHFEVQLLNRLMEPDGVSDESSALLESSSLRTPTILPPSVLAGGLHTSRPNTPLSIVPSTPSADSHPSEISPSEQPSEVTETSRPMSTSKLPSVLQQVNRIRNLFCRQMTVPLAGLPDLFDEYRCVL